MSKPYHLCLLSLNKPKSLNESYNSVQMMVWSLWDEFSKLPHITLEFQSISEPLIDKQYDFVLFHSYFSNDSGNCLSQMRKRVRYKTLSFLETKANVDYCFTYLPNPHPADSEEILLPCPTTILDSHNATKIPGSILLDHIWQPDLGTWRELSPSLYEWFEPCHTKYSISQLKRDPTENFPNWVLPITAKAYPIYLDSTAHFETYILTHPGTYEHSVLDMAYRGTRVLVPCVNNTLFIAKSIIDRLGLSTFSTKDELLALIDAPINIMDKRGLFTSISKVVSVIDAYCQRCLDSN